MLYVVGLGLGDEKDITVNGLEAVKKCERVYLEAYTSILGVPKERLEALYGLSLIHISEPTRPLYISYAVFCLKKKKT